MAETWIYLSPHLDDAVYSAGGLIYQQAQAGDRVSIWTLFAGDVPEGPHTPFARGLLGMWGMAGSNGDDAGAGNPFAERRREDQRAAELLGAETRHYVFTDAAFRQEEPGGPYLYPTDTLITGRPRAADRAMAARLLAALKRDIPQGARVVSPLALGGHVDHGFVRAAAQNLEMTPAMKDEAKKAEAKKDEGKKDEGKKDEAEKDEDKAGTMAKGERHLMFYEDYPYALKAPHAGGRLTAGGLTAEVSPLTAESLEAWLTAAAAYASQTKMNWGSEGKMRDAISRRARAIGGARLWRPK